MVQNQLITLCQTKRRKAFVIKCVIFDIVKFFKIYQAQYFQWFPVKFMLLFIGKKQDPLFAYKLCMENMRQDQYQNACG